MLASYVSNGGGVLQAAFASAPCLGGNWTEGGFAVVNCENNTDVEGSYSFGSKLSTDTFLNDITSINSGIVISIVIVVTVILLSFAYKRKRNNSHYTARNEEEACFIPLGEIEICKRISSGSFGVVFRGIYLGTSTVALKKLKGDDIAEFEAEAAILQKLSHPNM